jgi:hypothetical protein
LLGQQEERLDSYLNLFLVYKNLEAFQEQYQGFDEETYRDLEGSIQGVTSAKDTLSPLHSVMSALEAIAEEHPDNYTQFISSDAGRAALFGDALQRLMSPPKTEWSLLTPGEGASEAIDKNMADIPILKGALVNTVEILGDPLFIAAVVAFPPAGLAAKARLGGEIAVGMAVGEEAAEAAGLPGIVGAIPGGVLAPAALGFTRASLRAALQKARHNPVPGEPATEILLKSGEIPGLDDMRVAMGGEPT